MIGIVNQFWFEMAAVGLTVLGMSLIAALLAYQCVLKKKQSANASLVAYGVICPLVIGMPLTLIHLLDLQNPVLKLTAVSGPALLVLRCMETLYDTLPHFASNDLKSFLWYFATTVEFNFDPKTQQPIPATGAELRRKALVLASLYLQASALFTLLVPANYSLFPRREIHTFLDMFHWSHMFNSYLMGALTKTVIEFGTSTLGWVVSFWSGYSTAHVNVRPLTCTTSPSDFWGRRWNTLVSSGLKRGIYRPCRTMGWSRPMAALLTFSLSGLLHEYFLFAMVFGSQQHARPDAHMVGGHMLFFIWNALVLIIDGLSRRTKVLRACEQSLPQPARTILVLMTVLPVAHIFTDNFIANGFYSGFSLGYPRIIRIATTATSLPEPA